RTLVLGGNESWQVRRAEREPDRPDGAEPVQTAATAVVQFDPGAAGVGRRQEYWSRAHSIRNQLQGFLLAEPRGFEHVGLSLRGQVHVRGRDPSESSSSGARV